MPVVLPAFRRGGSSSFGGAPRGVLAGPRGPWWRCLCSFSGPGGRHSATMLSSSKSARAGSPGELRSAGGPSSAGSPSVARPPRPTLPRAPPLPRPLLRTIPGAYRPDGAPCFFLKFLNLRTWDCLPRSWPRTMLSLLDGAEHRLVASEIAEALDAPTAWRRSSASSRAWARPTRASCSCRRGTARRWEA